MPPDPAHAESAPATKASLELFYHLCPRNRFWKLKQEEQETVMNMFLRRLIKVASDDDLAAQRLFKTWADSLTDHPDLVGGHYLTEANAIKYVEGKLVALEGRTHQPEEAPDPPPPPSYTVGDDPDCRGCRPVPPNGHLTTVQFYLVEDGRPALLHVEHAELGQFYAPVYVRMNVLTPLHVHATTSPTPGDEHLAEHELHAAGPRPPALPRPPPPPPPPRRPQPPPRPPRAPEPRPAPGPRGGPV